MKKEISSIIAIIIMIVFTAIAFICDYTMSQAANSLVLTICATFTYALITLLQGNPNIYNMPYKIASEKRAQANSIMADTIIKIKTLTMLLLAAYTVLIRYSCPTLNILLTAIYIITLTISTIATFNKLKRLK